MNGPPAPRGLPPGGLASVDLNLLVMLEAVLEEESVTRAAARVGLSQPAMSHALTRLRKVFDDEILVRAGGRSVLTPRAHRLRGPVRDVLHRAEGLFDDGVFDPGADEREVVVAMTPSTALVLATRLAGLLAVEAPGIRLHALTTQHLSDEVFTQDGVDVMLLTESFGTARPRERLYDDEWVVLSGRPDLTSENALELLATRPHVTHEPLLQRAPYEALTQAGLTWTVAIRLHDPLLTPRFVAGTDRVGIHRRRVLDALETPGVYAVPLPLDTGALGMDMTWNPWLPDGEFRAWMRSVLRRAAP